MALQLIYMTFSRVLGWMLLLLRSHTAKEIEILVLRHQLAVLQRNTARPRMNCDGGRSGYDRADNDTTPRTKHRAGIARQVTQQRRGYAQAVLRALARSQQGHPTPQVQRTLREVFTPLGVRLSSATLRELAPTSPAGVRSNALSTGPSCNW